MNSTKDISLPDWFYNIKNIIYIIEEERDYIIKNNNLSDGREIGDGGGGI